jgi:hypothetical protein
MNMDPILHALDELATPEVYRRNPFHLFSLAVDATPRDIRRRREDIDAALATGSIKAELSRSLLLSPDLSPHAVSEAFARLENPVTRLLDEIFAFWPMPGKTCKQDGLLRQLASGGASSITDVCRAWDTLTPTESSHAAHHNLAVMHHLLALERESKDSKNAPDDFQRRGYWEDAVPRWAVVLDSGYFWDTVQSRAEALDDPRLTPQTVDAIQRELRSVLERICGALFAEHMKHKKWMPAKRQMEYAAEISGGPGAERILRDFFMDAARKTRLQAEEALKAAKADPSRGAREAERVLNGSSETIAAVDALLAGRDSLNRLRREIRDLVAETANQCQVIYANKTADWQTCLHILRLAYPIAESDGVKKQIQENIKIVVENDKQVKLTRTCWMCKTSTDLGTPETVTVYSPVEYENRLFGRGKFRIMEIKVPVCKTCREKHDKHGKICGFPSLAVIGAGALCGAYAEGLAGAIGGGLVTALICGIVFGSWIRNHVTGWTPESYPPVHELLGEGWSLKDPNSK